MTTETANQMVARVQAMTPDQMRVRLKEIRQEMRGLHQDLAGVQDENMRLFNEGKDAEALAGGARVDEIKAQVDALDDEKLTLEDTLDQL